MAEVFDSNLQASEPKVEVIESHFNWKIPIFILIFLILITVLGVNYFASNHKFVPEKLAMNCPVPKDLCQQGKIIKNGGQFLGLGYTLPVGSKILAAIPGNMALGGAEDKTLGIGSHGKLVIGGTGDHQGYTAVYEYFGLPAADKTMGGMVEANQEIAAVWGGSFPETPPYQGINLLFYVTLNNGQTLKIAPDQFTP